MLTPAQITQLRIPREVLTPILPSSRYIPDEIFADAQENPGIERQLFLLTCTQPLAELRINYPAVYNYLQQGVDAGISERYLCKYRALWYL